MISVLMAAYNEEKHIEEAIESILKQSYINIELIVVDDGSTDMTKQVVEKMALGDERLKFFSPGKLGKNGAFNYAAQNASGEWFVLFAADDKMEPGILETWMEHAIKTSSNQKIVYASRIRMFTDEAQFSRYDGIEIPKRKEKVCTSGAAFMGSKAVMEDLFPIPTNYPNEDNWISLYFQFVLPTFEPVPCICTNYRIHSGNSLRKNETYQKFNEKYHSRIIIGYDFLKKFAPLLVPRKKELIATRMKLEEMRYSHKIFQIILMKNISLVEKLRNIFLSNRELYRIKVALNYFFLGHSF